MVPDFMNHIDMEASKVTTSILRDIIKKWKGSGLDDLPLDPQQLKTLDQTISQVSDDLSAGRQPVFSNVLEDSGEVTVFLVERTGIPLLESCLQHKRGNFVNVQVLLDTGSALNVLRLDILQSLGFDAQDLDTNQKFKIITAGEGSIQGLGVIELDLFCVAANRKWYKFKKIKCLVISGGRAPDMIIGIDQLRQWGFSWNCRKHKTEEGIILDCENKFGPIRRRFVPMGQKKVTVKTTPEVNVITTDHRLDARHSVQLLSGSGHTRVTRVTLSSCTCESEEAWPARCHYQYSLEDNSSDNLAQTPLFVCREPEDPWAQCSSLDCGECFSLEEELAEVRKEIERDKRVPVMFTQNQTPVHGPRLLLHESELDPVQDETCFYSQPQPELPEVAFGDHNDDVELIYEADVRKPQISRKRVPGETRKSPKIKPKAFYTDTVFVNTSDSARPSLGEYETTEAGLFHLNESKVDKSQLTDLLNQEVEEEKASSGIFNPTQNQNWRDEQHFETRIEERSEIEPPAIGGEKVRGVWIPFTDSVPPELKQQYQDLFVEMAGAISQHKYDLGTYRHQEATAVPMPGRVCHSAPRTYTTGELEIMKKTCLDLEASGVIARCSYRPTFTHSLLFVPKAQPSEKLDRSYVNETREEMVRKHGARLCSDLREVNLSTERMTSAVLPRLQDMLPLLSSKVSITIDLTSGYFQLAFDKESQELFGFWCQALGTWFKFRRICQGWINSATYFQFAVQFGLLDEKAWEDFLQHVDQDFPQHRLRQLPLVETIINYLDDLTLIQFCHRNLFYVLRFVLLRLLDCNLKLNPAKVAIAGPESAVEILGITINNARNIYSLSPARASMISDYKYPMSRIAVRSKLAGLAYFSLVLPGAKNLMYCLGLLAKTKNRFTHLYVHKIEFLAMKFLACCKVELTLPDLSKPLYISSDASYSVYSFNSFQIKKISPELQDYYNSSKSKSSRENFINSPADNQEIFKKQSINGFTVEWTSVYSRSFSSAYLVKPPYYKELVAIYSALVNLESWIRRCPRATLYTDCKAIFLSSLGKETSSRLSSIALFISSLSNLSVVHSKGNFGMCQLADYLSRVLGDQKIKTPVNWDLNKIEDLSDVTLPDNLLVTPAELQRVMLAALPAQFSAFPSHKRQPQAHLPYYDLFEDLKQYRSETEIVTTMLRGGYESLDKENTVAFRTDGKKPFNKIEFSKFVKATELGDLKNDLSYVVAHINHADLRTESQLSQVRSVMIRLRDYLETHPSISLPAEIRQNILDFCRAPSSASINGLIDQLMGQTWFAQNCLNDVLPAELVLLSPHPSSEASLVIRERELIIGFREAATISPGEIKRLSVMTDIKTRCRFDVLYGTNDDIQVMTVQHMTGKGYLLEYVLIMNVSEQVQLITAEQELCRVRFNPPELLCPCSGPAEVIVILNDNDSENIKISESVPDAAREMFYVFYLTNMPSWRKFTAVNICKDNVAPLFLCTRSDEINESHIAYNKLVILSKYLTDNRTFTKDTIKQVQERDPELFAIITKLRDGVLVDKFVLRGGLLFRLENVEESRVHALCLDEVMTQLLCESLHANNLHYSERVLTEMLRRMFFHFKMKAIVRRVSKNCPACVFSTPSFQRHYIGRQLGQNPKVGQIMHSDLSESHSLDKKGFKYVLVIADQKSSFALFLPLKQKSSREVAAYLNTIFAWWVPEKFVSDYGTCYRGDVSDVLQKFHVVHEKSTVSRPEGNAIAERTVKLGRDFLRKCLLNMPTSMYRHWSSQLSLITAVYNHGLTKDLRLSRQALFLGSHFYNSPRFLNVQMELTETEGSLMHSAALQQLDKTREDQRRRLLATSGPDQFTLPENSLVLHVPDKNFQIQRGLPGDQPTAYRVFRVLSQTQTGARLYNLATGIAQTVDKKKLLLLTELELLKCLPLDSGLKGSFQRGIFTPGDGKMILADIYKVSEEGYLKALVDERMKERSLDEMGRPLEEEAEGEELTEPEHSEITSDDIARPEENEAEDVSEQNSEFHRLQSSHRYSLRPRAVRSNFLNRSEHFGLYHLAKLMGLAETLP